jgi:uncharacterized membrane protein YcaP (DUF421 family)
MPEIALRRSLQGRRWIVQPGKTPNDERRTLNRGKPLENCWTGYAVLLTVERSSLAVSSTYIGKGSIHPGDFMLALLNRYFLAENLWTRMFLLPPDAVDIVEKMLRPIFVYLFLLVGLRIAGKRELAQLNAFDLIVLLTLSNTVQNAIIGNDNSVSGGIIGATTLLAVNYGVVRLMHRFRKLDRLIEGRADILMRDGKIVKDHLAREFITHAQLEAAARKQGIASLHEVERCILESTGTITFVQKRPLAEDSRHNEIMGLLHVMKEEMRILRATSAVVKEAEHDLTDAANRPTT